MGLVEEVHRDGWTELVLDRADRRNALSSQMADDLTSALDANAGVPGIVLSARGPVFCAGADLSEGMSLSDDRPSSRIQRALLGTPSFVVAVVRGGVYGAGIGLLATCPVVLGTAAATFGIPEARRGIFPLGVVPYLEQHLPRRRLLALGVEGGSIPADEAHASGLITELIHEDEIDARAVAWMELVRERPTVVDLARTWWREPLIEPAFANRVGALEALLADHLPATNGGAP